MKFKKILFLAFSLSLGFQAQPISTESIKGGIGLAEVLTYTGAAGTAAVIVGHSLYFYNAQKQRKLLDKVFKDESFTEEEIKELSRFISNITDIGWDSKIPGLYADSYYQHFMAAYFLRTVLQHPQLKLNKEIVDTCTHIVLANLSNDSIWDIIDAYLAAVSNTAINEDDADSLCEKLLQSRYKVETKKSSDFSKLVGRSNKVKRKLVSEELENYLNNKAVQNGYCCSPLLQKLKKFKEIEKTQPLLPNLHEFKKGPTKKIIKKYPQIVVSLFGNQVDLEVTQRISHEVIERENQEHEKGRYTFLHGEPKKMYALQYWFTKLYEITRNVDLGDYLFTRFELDASEKNLADAQKQRKNNLEYGNRSDVFMGFALHPNKYGGNPGLYFLSNRQIFSYKNSLANIFEQFNLTVVYEQFADELLALKKEYEKLCPAGQILMFSFSPEALRECVYPSNPGWGKRTITITDPISHETYETYDMVEIANMLKKKPTLVQDIQRLEFCFIPTIDYGLHPNVAGKEVRIFSLNGADPEKMKAYKEKEQALFEKIKAAITTVQNTLAQ